MPPDYQQAAGGGTSPEEMQAFADSLPPNKWEEIRAHLETLPEDEREQWFADFTADHAAGRVDAQDSMSRADSLRVGQPGMIGEQGGYQMAASPFEHIGAGMQNYNANQQYQQGQADLATANQGAAGQRAQGAQAAVGPMGTPGINPAGGPPIGGGPAGRGAAPGGGMGGAIRSMAGGGGGGGPGRSGGPGGGRTAPGMGITPEMLKMMAMRGG